MDRTNHVAVAYVIVALAVAAILITTTAPNQFVKAQQPSQNATQPSQNATQPSQNATQPSQNATQPSQGTSQFTANLTGDLAFPPTATNATGTAEFTVAGDGSTLRYIIDAKNIDKVTDVYVAASSGGRYVDLVQLRSGVNEGPTGPISGTLVEGNFTSADFTGRLNIDQMSDLLKLILDGNAFVRVQTIDEPLGKIVGKITPSNLPS